jgi:hypothetical protein
MLGQAASRTMSQLLGCFIEEQDRADHAIYLGFDGVNHHLESLGKVFVL